LFLVPDKEEFHILDTSLLSTQLAGIIAGYEPKWYCFFTFVAIFILFYFILSYEVKAGAAQVSEFLFIFFGVLNLGSGRID
jgi:hypothetical protein